MLLLRFELNGRWHEDLILEFAGDTFRLRVHFSLSVTGSDLLTETSEVLRQWLEQWLTLVGALKRGAALYLPHDRLHCSLAAENLELCLGTSALEGHRIVLADLQRHATDLTDFRARGPSGRCTRGELIRDINRSIAGMTVDRERPRQM